MNKKIAIITLILLGGFCLVHFATAFSVLDVAPTGFNYEAPNEISKEAAEKALENAEVQIIKMRQYNFVTLFPNDALVEAKQAYTSEDYETVLKLTQLIDYIQKQKFEFYDKMKLLEIKTQAMAETSMEEKEIEDKNMEDVHTMMQQAMNSFNFEQLDEANNLLDAADKKIAELSKERARANTIAVLSKNFFVKYWWQILIVFVLLVVVGYFTFEATKKRLLKLKIERLKLEIVKTTELIKILQKDCFVEHKMTTNAYKERSFKYEERINEIKQILPVLEAELKSLNRKSGLIKKKYSEKFFKKVSGIKKDLNNKPKKKRVEKKRVEGKSLKK